jgi:predicted AAA+ superfamily ATPase|tara:strand:+ start:491 stop:847 length:357 start_codon:yes stop_codon:yes gene_type:complete
MSIASALVNVADKVISKFGGDVTIRVVGAGAYNANTGTVAETNTDSEVKGILEDVVNKEANELVQAGDKRLTVAAKDLDAAPATKDKVLVNSVVHQIISVKTNEQENTAVTYELILRA